MALLARKFVNASRMAVTFFAIATIWAISSVASAVAPADGFFYGVELEPVGDATIATAEAEPAIALIFAADQKTADVTREFNEWYSSAAKPAIEVYAIAVEPTDVSRAVVMEAINQRDLQMPVFLARSDMLLGDDFRLVLLNNDQEVQRFTTLNLTELNAAIAELGINVPSAPVPQSVPAVTPGETAPVEPDAVAVEPKVNVEVESGVLPDGSTFTSITTTTRTTDERLLGGLEVDNVYINEQYGMTVEFPPGWTYQVAAQEDGAVAIEPPGSQLDMRIWALAAGSVQTPQEYIDETLESLARKYRTRVNVDRHFQVSDDGEPGIDISYSYTKPFDIVNPARGGLLHRGRMQVFIDEGYVKAASVDAPSGEYRAALPTIEAFFLSFEIRPEDNPAAVEYNSPNI